MPISDSSPDRRNLVLMSLAFLIFYLGDGAPATTDGKITLSIISITLNSPQVLPLFAWGLFLWFSYRFYILWRHSLKECVEDLCLSCRGSAKTIFKDYFRTDEAGKISPSFVDAVFKWHALSCILTTSAESRGFYNQRTPEFRKKYQCLNNQLRVSLFNSGVEYIRLLRHVITKSDSFGAWFCPALLGIISWSVAIYHSGITHYWWFWSSFFLVVILLFIIYFEIES